jgi:hypothetical protein
MRWFFHHYMLSRKKILDQIFYDFCQNFAEIGKNRSKTISRRPIMIRLFFIVCFSKNFEDISLTIFRQLASAILYLLHRQKN